MSVRSVIHLQKVVLYGGRKEANESFFKWLEIFCKGTITDCEMGEDV